MYKVALVQEVHDALYSAIIICYAQGLAMLQKASTELEMEIPLQDAVKVWRAGCIIRSSMLAVFYTVCNNNPSITNIDYRQTLIKLGNKIIVTCRNSYMKSFDHLQVETLPDEPKIESKVYDSLPDKSN